MPVPRPGRYTRAPYRCRVLTALAQQLFGRAGLVLIAAIFIITCFNTCVGLIACVGQYFHQLLPRIYPALAAFFAAASMLVSNLGLAAIIRLSTPVLNAIYPAAIVLICSPFRNGCGQRRAVYPLYVGLTALQAIAAALPLKAPICRCQCSAAGQHWLLAGYCPHWPGLQAGCSSVVFPLSSAIYILNTDQKGLVHIIDFPAPLPFLRLLRFS